MSSRRWLGYTTLAIVAIWAASEWWEKGLAKRTGPGTVSPNGCYRVESYEAFWILPNILHRRPDQDGTYEWFPWWGKPGFYRAYDERTRKAIGETEILDIYYTGAGSGLFWGYKGHSEIDVGGIVVAPISDCLGG
jgi:hypothetical protein